MRRVCVAVVCTVLGSLLASTPAQATPFTIHATMSATQEVPPNASPATGTIDIFGDDVINLLTVSLTWSGLIGGPPSAAHIHCCTAPGTNIGVAIGFPGFPASTSGSYSNTFDLLDAATYTSGFINNFGGGTVFGARTALITGLLNGTAYSNIHNATFPGGEIRANLLPTAEAVPEPATLTLLGLGLGAAALRRRRRP